MIKLIKYKYDILRCFALSDQLFLKKNSEKLESANSVVFALK